MGEEQVPAICLDLDPFFYCFCLRSRSEEAAEKNVENSPRRFSAVLWLGRHAFVQLIDPAKLDLNREWLG